MVAAAPREADGAPPLATPPAAGAAKGGSTGDTTAPARKQRPAENVVILPSGLDSGDIVLFNRRCLSMPPYGAAICGVAKLFSNSSWDHVGIVVRRPASATAPDGAAVGEEEEELLFLEADLGGVKLRSLRERLARSKSNEIAIRRLSAVRTDEMREKLYSFAQDMLGTPYETGTGQLISSIIDPQAKQERERLHALLLDKRVQLSEIDRELSEAALTAFQRRTLEKERARVDATRRAIHDRLAAELSSSADGYFESKDDLSRVFCSGLVAAAYQRAGLLESYPPAAGYSPKDFSSEQTNPPGVYLLRGARLSDEVYVRRTPKKRTADGDVAEDADAAAPVVPAPRVGGVTTGDVPSRSSRLVISSAIKRTPIDSVLSDQYKRSGFVRAFRAVVVEPGDLVFQQGSYGDSLYVVESGSLDRFVAKGSGDPKLVSTLGPGNTFGTTAVMFNSPRMSTLRAKERCLLWAVSRPTLERIKDTTDNVQDILSTVDTRRLRTLLRDHFLFKRLDRLGPQELNHFFLVKFRAGEEVFKQGDPGDNFYIIKSGELERHIRHPRPGRGSRLAGGVAGKGGIGDTGRGLLSRDGRSLDDDEDDEEEEDEEDEQQDGSKVGGAGDRSGGKGGGGSGGGDGAARGRRKGRQPKRRRSSLVDDDDSDSGGAFGTGWAEKEYRTLSLTLGPGQSFGELSLMYNAPRAATVRARTDVECWAISAESFHRLHLGGGANYLRSVFKTSASVTRDGQSYMTPADVLSFANVDALPAADRERLSSLLLALVSCHRDRSRDDSIDEAALAAGSGGSGIGGKRRRRARRSDAGLVDFWEFVRFDIVLNQPAAELDFAFRLADKNNSGFVDLEEIQSLLAEYAPVDEQARQLLSGPSPALVRVFGPDGTRVLSYKEFCAVGDDFLPPTFRRDIRTLARHLLHDTSAETPAGGAPTGEVFEPASASLAADAALTASSSPKVRMEFSHLFAVAVSGALARTAVAPLDRLKILRQVTPPSTSPRWLRRQAATAAASNGGSAAATAARPAGTWVGLKGVVDMVRRDGGGVRALFRGNGANVIRIVPATAVQLVGVEYLRTHPLAGELASATGGRVGQAAPWETVVILGGLAGMAAAAVTYPLDVIRGRLSVQSAASFAAAAAAVPAVVPP